MRVIFTISLTFILSVLLNCRSAPIYNAEHIPISPRDTATIEEIAEAIWSAGRRLGWKVEKIKPGESLARLKIRSHSATVKILFNTQEFSIIYLNSKNLDQDDGEIHENYNVWIKRLEEKIRNEIGFRLP